jgi:hypothetical protein
MISLSSKITIAQEQLSSDLGGEIVILNAKSGQYYGLNPMGATIWGLLEQPKTVKELQELILEQYEVDALTCEQDLRELLHQMQEKGLIEVDNESNL